MRIFVAGGTGVIGARLVPQLVARGHDVIATTRSATKVAQLRAGGAEPVVVNGLDRSAVVAAVLRAYPDVIVHQLTALSGKADMKHFDTWFTETNKLRTRGTDNLLAAAETAGVGRFVAQSYTGWTNSTTGSAIKSESDALEAHPAPAQTMSLRAIRYLEQAVHEEAVTGLVLRYGGLYGPGASDEFVDLARRRKIPVVGTGAGVWSWIHVDDASAATVAAIERGAPGTYQIVDDEPAPVSEWLPALAAAAGGKPPRHVPRWLAGMAVGEVGVRWMTQARGASNQRAKRELGWQLRFPTWRDGFRQGLRAEPIDAAGLEALIGAPDAEVPARRLRPASSAGGASNRSTP